MIQELQGFWQDETGQSSIEYIVITVTVVVIMIPILKLVMNHVKCNFECLLVQLGTHELSAECVVLITECPP